MLYPESCLSLLSLWSLFAFVLLVMPDVSMGRMRGMRVAIDAAVTRWSQFLSGCGAAFSALPPHLGNFRVVGRRRSAKYLVKLASSGSESWELATQGPLPLLF